MRPDIVNGIFELGGGLFMWLNVWKLRRDRKVRGVHWTPTMYFALWGYWNLYYYPFLRQWCSLFGGISVMLANTVYVIQIIHYIRKEKREKLIIQPPTDIRIGDRTFRVTEEMGEFTGEV